MPVVRVPVSHKFGILSQGQAGKLLKEVVEKKTEQQPNANPKSPCKIDWDYVVKFCSSSGPVREQAEERGRRALLQIKHKLSTSYESPANKTGRSEDLLKKITDKSDVWYELIFLAQCEGHLQGEALLILAASLTKSPLSPAHLPCLLYIVGLGYRWLKSDEVHETFLQSREILLLHVMLAASLRLYVHLITGSLNEVLLGQDGEQFKADYEGLLSKDTTYQNHPDALFCWNVTKLVGAFINSVIDGGEIPAWKEMGQTGPEAHSLPSYLWHALDAWKCSNSFSSSTFSFDSAIVDLIRCNPKPHQDQLLESILAMGILFSVGRTKIDALTLLQLMASGFSFELPQDRERSITGKASFVEPPCVCRVSNGPVPHKAINLLGQQVAFKESSHSSSHNCNSLANKLDETTLHSSVITTTGFTSSSKLPSSSSFTNGKNIKRSFVKSPHLQDVNQTEVITALQKSPKLTGRLKPRLLSSTSVTSALQFAYVESEAPLDDGTVFLGSIAPSTVLCHSPTSSPSSLRSDELSKGPSSSCERFEDYPFELAASFCMNMMSVVVHGITSCIQEQALVGYSFIEEAVAHLDCSSRNCRDKLYGLTQLASYIKPLPDVSNGGPAVDEESYRIRYVAIQGLLNVTHTCKSQTVKDGFSSVAWETLLSRHTAEKDKRVFPAFRSTLGMSSHFVSKDSDFSVLFDQIAEYLSTVFLPESNMAEMRTTADTLTVSSRSPQRSTPSRHNESTPKSPSHQPGRRKNLTKSKVSTHWDTVPKKPASSEQKRFETLKSISEKDWKKWKEEEAREYGQDELQS